MFSSWPVSCAGPTYQHHRAELVARRHDAEFRPVRVNDTTTGQHSTELRPARGSHRPHQPCIPIPAIVPHTYPYSLCISHAYYHSTPAIVTILTALAVLSVLTVLTVRIALAAYGV